MRVIMCCQVGIECADDHRTLLDSQCEDGSYDVGWMYSYGSTGVKIGNRGVTTAMAVKALSCKDVALKENCVNGLNKVSGVDDLKEMCKVYCVRKSQTAL